MTGIHQVLVSGAPGSPYLLDIITNLGLTSNLNFVLDAADTRSYDGSSQTWTDATGNGNNFFRGTTSGADATDPTFTGVAGDGKDTTYFSFDGGDYFTETAAHTFADNWHKDNGALSLIAIVYIDAAGTAGTVFSNEAGAFGLDGINFRITATPTIGFVHAITATTAEAVLGGALSATSWNFLGVSFSEAALNLDRQGNATAGSVAMTASTDTDANGEVLRIGATGNALQIFPANWRLACIAGWSTNIGATALNNIYTQLKSLRFTSLP